MKHHDEALERFTKRMADWPDCVGVIVVGSVARGRARADSDVDVYLVVTESEFERARDSHRLSYVTSEDTDYDGGYVDVKVASLDYLRQAALSADEPARASFISARVVWTRDSRVADVIRRIATLDKFVFEERARSFVAQARLQAWYFTEQAHLRDDTFLRYHAATHLVMACGRALLAANHVLFQGPKHLEELVDQLADKPENIRQLMHEALTSPQPATAHALLGAVESFREWNLSPAETLSVFVEDNELGWLTGAPPPHFR
jgi:predicted nucleotidyltransferase